jgi:hypothetical protein
MACVVVLWRVAFAAACVLGSLFITTQTAAQALPSQRVDTPSIEARSQQTAERPHRIAFEVAALSMVAPELYDLPLEAYGGRATLGAQVRTSQVFSYAPQLVIEHYRGSTPNGLGFSSSNIAILMDVAIALPWLHWELYVGRGVNDIQRVTTYGSMSRWDDAAGISVSPELRVGDHGSVFALLGERWLGDVRTTVFGLGYRR